MIASLIKKFLREKRAATAVAMAIMTVPLLISASAAVDFARIASARTLLQASVDGAAIAGAGEWQMSESSSDALNVTNTDYSGTGKQLPNFVSASSPVITLACTGTIEASGQTTSQCGGSAPFSRSAVAGCPTNSSGQPTFEYCVVVSATVTLKNSLFAWMIPSELLSVKSIATANFPPTSISGKNIPPSPGFGSAGDVSGIYAYAVPMDAPGNTANFNELPPPNTYCSTATAPLKYENLVPPGTGVTACNYLFVANSLNQTGSGGSITLQQDQPIAFAFVNETGANGYHSTDSTHYTTNIVEYSSATGGTGTYYQDGDSAPAYTTTTTQCYGWDQDNCQTYTTNHPATPLYGQCPNHTLYGSIDHNNGTPVSDSLNEYSSAYEVLGYPPTHNTNHALTPFIATNRVKQTVNGTTYYTAAICPNYPTENTQISAPISSTYAASNPSFVGMNLAGLNIFSTWFPNVTLTGASTPFTDTYSPATDSNGNALTNGITNGVPDVFPPEIAGCTPATNASDGGVTPTADDPWWGWNGSNYSRCTQPQTSNYSDCALLMQQLGTNVPVDSNNVAVLPDYYNTIEDASGNVLALDPVYDNTTYIDPLTNVSVTNTSPAGYTPTNTTASSTTIGLGGLYNSGQFVGDFIVTQVPATSGIGKDHNMPLATSHKCYDSSVATKNMGFIPPGSSVSFPGYNTNGFAIDPIANPQFGAIYCNTNPPETYALYWNDLGTYGMDDLGYWNAVEAFTCSVPPSTNTGGGAATLSG